MSIHDDVAKTLKDIHELEDLLRVSVDELKKGLMHKASDFTEYGDWLQFMHTIASTKEEFNTMVFYGREAFFGGRHV
jgi:hypothetical protein